MNRFIGFLTALIFSFLLTSCKDFKEVQCTGVKGFKINTINTQGIDADIMLGIKNPNNMGFSIYKSEFDVVYSGVNLGKARLTKRVHINANAEETYSFNLKSDFKNINLSEIMKLMSAGNARSTVEVKGDLKAGKFYMKKKFPIDVKERVGAAMDR